MVTLLFYQQESVALKVLTVKECQQVSAGDISTDPILVGVGILGIVFFVYSFAPGAITVAIL